jgi:hypothetical protein
MTCYSNRRATRLRVRNSSGHQSFIEVDGQRTDLPPGSTVLLSLPLDGGRAIEVVKGPDVDVDVED